MTGPRRDACRYQPFYCEENAWFLAWEPALDEADPHLIFVSNRGRTCAMWNQRAVDEGEPVVWDYHAVVLGFDSGRALIWDFDARGPFPMLAGDWLRTSFAPPGALDAEWEPRFRAFDRGAARRDMASDRRHMRVDDGTFVKPPPNWTPPGPTPAGDRHTLDRILDADGGQIDSPWLTQLEFERWIAARY